MLKQGLSIDTTFTYFSFRLTIPLSEHFLYWLPGVNNGRADFNSAASVVNHISIVPYFGPLVLGTRLTVPRVPNGIFFLPFELYRTYSVLSWI